MGLWIVPLTGTGNSPHDAIRPDMPAGSKWSACPITARGFAAVVTTAVSVPGGTEVTDYVDRTTLLAKLADRALAAGFTQAEIDQVLAWLSRMRMSNMWGLP